MIREINASTIIACLAIKSNAPKVRINIKRVVEIGCKVNVLFSALTPAQKNITFAASTLKQESYAERKSQLRKSTICISCAGGLRI